MRVMTRRQVIAAAAAVLTLASPRAGNGQVTRRNVARQFEISAGQVFGQDGRVYLILSTSISYRRLVFFRKPTGYEAKYRLFVEIEGEGGEQVLGEVYVQNVFEPDYDSTVDRRRTSDTRRTIPVDPGDYDVRARIEVEGTSLKYERKIKIRIYGRDRESLEIADPVFSVPEASRASEAPSPGELEWSLCSKAVSTGFSPLPGRAFESLSGWLRMSLTVYTPVEKRADGDMVFSIRVTAPDNRVVAYNRKRIRIDDSGSSMMCFDLSPEHIPPGRYTVDAAASLEGSSEKAVRSARFTLVLTPSMLYEYFDDTLEVLSWIIEDKDLEDLRNAPPSDREEEWNRLWENFTPEPSVRLENGLDDLLQRLQFAMENFGEDGWKTDMGRIYVTYGPPDLDEERDGRVLGSKFRLWYYYSMGVVFIFEDPGGTGRFRLRETRST